MTTAPDTTPAPGSLIAGKYIVDRTIGVGGMGVVLAATHKQLDEKFAIKCLLPELVKEKEVVARFLREGQAAIKIKSEHVVRVFDVGELENGAPYMVLEYLEGKDLDDLVKTKGPLQITEAIDFVSQALEALAEAHALGMVHRDLKPANLFLTHRADGSPCIKVLDFGISKVAARPGEGTNMGLTNAAAVMGSPQYMAPEQMRSARDVDARADVWALGAILHELLAGGPPFRGNTYPELFAQILQDNPPPLANFRADVPPALEQAIARAMQKDPALRFANVAELAFALAPMGSPLARTSAERIARVLQVAPPMSQGTFGQTDLGRAATVSAPPPGVGTNSGVVVSRAPAPSYSNVPQPPSFAQPSMAPAMASSMPQAPMPQAPMAIAATGGAVTSPNGRKFPKIIALPIVALLLGAGLLAYVIKSPSPASTAASGASASASVAAASSGAPAASDSASSWAAVPVANGSASAIASADSMPSAAPIAATPVALDPPKKSSRGNGSRAAGSTTGSGASGTTAVAANTATTTAPTNAQPTTTLPPPAPPGSQQAVAQKTQPTAQPGQPPPKSNGANPIQGAANGIERDLRNGVNNLFK